MLSRAAPMVPRVHAELRAEGRAVGKKRIARLMRGAGIVGVSRRRGVIITRRDRDARPAPDLVQRRLTSCFYPQTKTMLRRPLESAQYTSLAFGGRCREAGVRPSMGSVGDAYDNAMCESFFATLECELLARRRFTSQAEARMAVFSYIEGWYNPARRHSGIRYLSPIAYETQMFKETQTT
jgi:putative transposase